jgi:hypothetical protein
MNYILSRVESQGEQFLTITLPQFGKDFEKSLDRGGVASGRGSFGNYGSGDPSRNVFVGYAFGKSEGRALPLFLSGFTSRIFDSNSGGLVDDVGLECVRAVRQICLMFGKIRQEVSDEKLSKAFIDYVDCDTEVRHADFLERKNNIVHSLAYLHWSSELCLQGLTYGSGLVTIWSRSTGLVQQQIEFLETESTISILGPSVLRNTFHKEGINSQVISLI